MEKLIDISSSPVVDVLDLLLQDKSTKKNIIWATDTYEEFGEGFTDKVQMLTNVLLLRPDIIRPRIQKSLEAQAQRTRKKAEVFTPAWLCNRMNNHCDEEWFGRSSVFNTEKEDHTWTVTEGRIDFPKRKKWQNYVDSRRLEITCGEAPYLVSRYDVSNGELIVPLVRRIGMLDRKLRIVNENTDTYEEWLKWTIRAFEASYGYEYQGDNVLIARINLLLTFVEYYEERWGRSPNDKLLEQIANKIAWNIWQMDGLKGSIPMGALYKQYHQLTIFDVFGMEDASREIVPEEYIPCSIFDWRGQNKSIDFNAFREGRNGSMKFDYIIGNPPYQDETVGDNATYAPQIYNRFMDASYEIAQSVILIHPARFLFDAGSTPKAWNKKMLDDAHFKILCYEADSKKIFPGMEITGGIAVSHHDSNINFGPVGVFTPFDELNSILHKVIYRGDFKGMDKIVISRTAYRITDKLHKEHPEAISQLSKGHAYDMASNIFERLPQVFFDKCPENGGEYIVILGRDGGDRARKYILRDYVKPATNLDNYKIVLARADGAAGTIGKPIPARILGTPVIEIPGVGTTESFISIGSFNSDYEVGNAFKYLKTKFFRTLVSVLKTTQDITPDKFKYVPIQSFIHPSDIDWSKSISEIDRQLYLKYGLSDEEISFIETHVKEME